MQAPVGFRIIASGSEFEARVEDVVRAIPAGAVAAYSAVAEQAGRPGAARAVGAVMARSEGLPWHRVVTVAGHGRDGYGGHVDDWRRAMGIDWMTRDELAQAIPPVYTRFVGDQLLAHLTGTPVPVWASNA